MKNLMCIATFFVASTMFAACDRETQIAESKLPTEAQNFLKTHFNGVAVNSAIKEVDDMVTTYTVYLANQFEIDFTKSGEWDEVDGHINAVPQSIVNLIPAGIAQYVQTNFPNATIVKVNKERRGFDIELSGDIELDFDTNGNFVKMD